MSLEGVESVSQLRAFESGPGERLRFGMGWQARGAAVLLLLSACASSPPAAPAPAPEPDAEVQTTVSIGQEFSLSPGGKAVLPASDTTIEFADVTEDSRCPVGARCIWAGQVTVLLRIALEDAKSTEAKLTLRVDENKPASEQVGAFLIRLLSVDPYPEPQNPIQRQDYLAKLVVEAG